MTTQPLKTAYPDNEIKAALIIAASNMVCAQIAQGAGDQQIFADDFISQLELLERAYYDRRIKPRY
ncbi:hypothetical protein GLF_0890 [Gluconobacter frateurii NBRC 101659]|nr:hypothetical protein GLF_0890 [Gluconobacter frateurii NBRC 101659]